MAGSYYVQSETKTLLNIRSTDTADDTLLDLLGNLANQHIDNILEIYDEKLPYQGTNVLNDAKMAANYYTASLYMGNRHNKEMADHWMAQYDSIIEGMKAQRQVDNPVYIVERSMGRVRSGDHDHFFAEWL